MANTATVYAQVVISPQTLGDAQVTAHCLYLPIPAAVGTSSWTSHVFLMSKQQSEEKKEMENTVPPFQYHFSMISQIVSTILDIFSHFSNFPRQTGESALRN